MSELSGKVYVVGSPYKAISDIDQLKWEMGRVSRAVLGEDKISDGLLKQMRQIQERIAHLEVLAHGHKETPDANNP